MDFYTCAILGNLIPELRNGNHHAACADALYHTCPRLNGVKRGTAAAVIDSRHRVGKTRSRISTCPFCCACAVPTCTVDFRYFYSHRTGLVCWNVMVCSCCNLHSNSSRAISFCGYGYSVSADAYRSNTGFAGSSRNCSVTASCYRNSFCGIYRCERCGRGTDAQTPRRLTNTPRNGLCGNSSIAPTIVDFRSERSVVTSSICARCRTANSYLVTVIIAPTGRKCATGVGQSPALRGNRDSSSANAPSNIDRILCVVSPHIIPFGFNGRCIGSGIRSRCCTAERHFVGVVTVQTYRLR